MASKRRVLFIYLFFQEEGFKGEGVGSKGIPGSKQLEQRSRERKVTNVLEN